MSANVDDILDAAAPLPQQTVGGASPAKTGESGRWFGFDIGGTLAKLVFFEPHTAVKDLAVRI